ncbi:MAG: DedA family protein [Chitinophagales bacterium]
MELKVEVFLNWIAPFVGDPVALAAVLGVAGLLNVFFPPLPIEALALAAGAVAGAGYGSPFVIWLACATGMAVGSTLLYLLAANQGHALLRHAFIARQVPEQALARVESWFGRYGVLTIFFGKLIPGLSFATVLASGLFGLRKRRALPAIYAANLVFFGLLVFAGRYVGRDWQRFVRAKAGMGWLAVALVALGAAGGAWLVRRVRRKGDPG